jgi:hypothetical protein
MALTADQLRRLAMMAGESHKPVPDRMLSDLDLQDIANDVAKVPDSTGLAPADSGYTDTYDLYRAAAEAWRRKAGQLAEEFDFRVEGGSFNRMQKYRAALEQASRYANMAQSLSAPTGALD